MAKIQTDISEFNLLTTKAINSDMRTIYIEEKPKGLVLLISNKIADGNFDIKVLKGIKIDLSQDIPFVELLGLDIKLELEILTRLNIDKKLIYIEEIENEKYRLTFSSTFIQDIHNIGEILILE